MKKNKTNKEKVRNMKMLQMGDTLLVKTNVEPETQKNQTSSQKDPIVFSNENLNMVVSACNELEGLRLVKEPNGDTYIENPNTDPAKMISKRHSSIAVQQGIWKIHRVREYEELQPPSFSKAILEQCRMIRENQRMIQKVMGCFPVKRKFAKKGYKPRRLTEKTAGEIADSMDSIEISICKIEYEFGA